MPNFISDDEFSCIECLNSLEDCLAHFEDSNDPMIQEIVNALQDPVHEKMFPTDSHLIPSIVEAPGDSDCMEKTSPFEESLEVSPSLWSFQTEVDHYWEDPFLINRCPVNALRRYFLDNVSFSRTCGENFYWPIMIKNTHVHCRAGLWMVLMRNLLKYMMILLQSISFIDLLV